VSLNPAPHIAREPIGMLVLPLLTSVTQGWAIGWASCPYDPIWARRFPRRSAVMAAAGPAGNLLIALIAFTVLRIGLWAEWFIAPAHVNFDSVVELAGVDGPSFLITRTQQKVTTNRLLRACSTRRARQNPAERICAHRE
jgi:hypothetical protein